MGYLQMTFCAVLSLSFTCYGFPVMISTWAGLQSRTSSKHDVLHWEIIHSWLYCTIKDTGHFSLFLSDFSIHSTSSDLERLFTAKLHYRYWSSFTSLCLRQCLCLSLSGCLCLGSFVSVSACLCLPLLPSGCCIAISTESEMFLLLMHTNAQPLTGADSMKREAAEINTYVMREKGPPNGLAICICQRLSSGCIDV